MLMFFLKTHAQSTIQLKWDSVKNSTSPTVLPAFTNDFGTPYRQPLASYGWEDGLHISPDGLNLYALYSPGDIFSWQTFFTTYTSLPVCSGLCNMSFIRSYANTYGIDLVTNSFSCDSFPNIDILYAHRSSTTSSFSTWQLSGISRPGAVEGGPAPLFSESNSSNLDLFCFTGNGDIWMLRNKPANPTGVSSATRLPSPINPITNEFIADNAFLERISGDTIILFYEKYTNPSSRTFMFTLSNDLGYSWSTPQAVTTVNNSLGHIEHPCLYKDLSGEWWLYFSIDYTYISKSKQLMSGNWDSWDTPVNIVHKGNAISIGEPTLTKNGDISFSVAYKNQVINDTTDVYDIDPWFLPNLNSPTNIKQNALMDQVNFSISPNPVAERLKVSFENGIKSGKIQVTNVMGELIKEEHLNNSSYINFNDVPNGIYFVTLEGYPSLVRKVLKLN